MNETATQKQPIAPRPLSKRPMFVAAMYAMFFGVFGYVFWGPLSIIIKSWEKEEYSYAYLVVPIAFLLGLHKLSSKPMEPRAAWTGVAVALAGLALHLIGVMTGLTVFPQYGFFASFLGAALAILGWKIFTLLIPVFGYLFFAIPLPTTLYISFSAKLQLFSSTLGTTILQLLGFSAYQEGNIIDLGTYQLQVVEACSGLRYIFPLLGFSYLVAYFYKDAFWKRFIVFISAIPFAVLLNVARIALVGVTVNYWGTDAAEGLLHDLEGWAIFTVCILLLFGEIEILKRIGKSGGHLDLDPLSLPRGPFWTAGPAIHNAFLVLFGVFLLIGLGQVSGTIAPQTPTIPARSSFDAFPTTIGSWQGRIEAMKQSEVDFLKLTDYLNIRYTNTQDLKEVFFFTAYYQSQTGENQLHSPEMCVPGSGWEMKHTSTHAMRLNGGKKPIYVNRSVIQKGQARQVLYYWFEQGGHNFALPLAVKWNTVTNALTTGRTDSALLRLNTPIAPNETEEDGDKRLEAFFNEAAPLLSQYLPDYGY